MEKSYFIKRNRCPGCHSRSFSTIYESSYTDPPIKDYLIDFYGIERVQFDYLQNEIYVLSECDFCEMIFQEYIPDNLLMKRIYETWIDPVISKKKKNSKRLQITKKNAYQFFNIVSHFGKNPSDIDVFDFGMGWSDWLFMAKAFGCNPYGSDLSEDKINYAKSNGVNVVDWKAIPNHAFDFINTEQVFEHIPDPLDALKHLKSALKPGGIIRISVPNSPNIERNLKILNWSASKGSKYSLNAVAPLEHINCFRRISILKMAKKVDLVETHFSFRNQYRYLTNITDWKSILRPILLNVLKKGNDILLTSS